MKVHSNLFKAFGVLLVAALLFAAMPASEALAQATTRYVDDDPNCGGQLPCYITIQAAIIAANPGDVISVASGTYFQPTTILLDKPITILGPDSGVASVVGVGGGIDKVFEILSNDVTIQNLTITLGMPPATYDGLVHINEGHSNISIINNEIFVALQAGTMDTWWGRAISAYNNTINLVVSNNTMYNTRTGVVMRYGSSGSFTDNVIYNTKGGIMNYTSSLEDVDGRVITGNSWNDIHNEWDIVWNSGGGPYVQDIEKNVIQMSAANNGAYVINQVPTEYTTPKQLLFSSRSHVFVDAINGTTVIDNNYGNMNVPYANIQDGIDAVAPGGTVYVAEGTYTEQVVVNKDLTIIGSGDPIITPPATVETYQIAESSKNWEPVVFIFGGTMDASNVVSGPEKTTVDMSGFIVDGADRVPIGRSSGFLFRNAGGTVSGNTVQNMSVNGKETFGISVYGDSVITLDGNSVSGYARGGIGVNGDNGVLVDPVATITNNTVTGPGMNEEVTWAPNGIQIGWGATGTIQGNTVTGNGWPGSEWTGSGILVYSSDDVLIKGNVTSENETAIAVAYADATAIEDNTVQNNEFGIALQSGCVDTSITGNTVTANIVDGIDVWGNPAPTGTVIEYNKIYGNNTGGTDNSGGLWVDSGVPTVDASPNWWGRPAGPGADEIIGDVDFIKWCAVEDCSILAPDDDGQVYLSGTYNIPGGFLINEPGLTYILADGTIIQNDSPCFTINASNTIIKAESTGGATCVPTDGSNGINVAAGLDQVEILNLVIDGIDPEGNDQDTGDGIHFAGAISNLWLVNNKIHGLDGDGVEFTAEPTGDVQIQGNLFMNNTGNGIEASTFAVPAMYNSWGHVNGAADDGDGASAGVDWTYWTHAVLELESSGTVYANQVVKDEEITYNIFGDLAMVQGAEFTLNFPSSELTYKPGSFVNHAFDTGGITAGTGSLMLYGYQSDTAGGVPTMPLNGEDMLLFSVTFTGDVFAKDLALTFSDENFAFAHFHDVAEVTSAALNFSSTGWAGWSCPLGETIFSGYVGFADGSSAEHLMQNSYAFYGPGATPFGYTYAENESGWIAQADNAPGTYYIYMQCGQVDTTGGPTNHIYAAGLTGVADLEVIELPTLTSLDIAGPYVAGLQQEFHVTITNTSDGGDFALVRVNFTLLDTVLDDIYSLQYYNAATGAWDEITNRTQDGDDVVGYFGPTTGFPMPAPYSATTPLRVIFKNPGSYDIVATLDTMDTDWTLATLSETAVVDGDFTVKGMVTMQGRLDRAGVPMTLTIQTLPVYGPFLGTSTTAMVDNLVFTGLNGGTYLVTTDQPRYLNVTAALDETFDVDGDETLPALHLLGGNAEWTDNVIDISDASIVGGAYGGDITTPEVNENGDVNFDNKVNIQDLALVGGNYSLTSDIYDGWLTP